VVREATEERTVGESLKKGGKREKKGWEKLLKKKT